MTQEFLQDAVVEDLKELFQGCTLKNSNGEDRSVNVYAQDVPIRAGADETGDEDALPEPYVVVRTTGGSLPEPDGRQEIGLVLVVCVCDEATDRQGHRDVLHLVNTICQRYARDGVAGKKYMVQYPIKWETQTEDTHPYYFAAVALNFDGPPFYREYPEA